MLFLSLLSIFVAATASPLVARQNASSTSINSDPSSSLYPITPPGQPNPDFDQNLYNQLYLTPLAADRMSMIQKLGVPTKFDFNNAANPAGGVSKGAGGEGNLANRKTFPVLIGLGLAMSAGFLNPCGMNTPHTHPRATEFLTIVQGNNVRTGFMAENGGPPQMSNTLNQFQGSILPQGSIHFEFNDNCEPAVFMAAFSNEDPGLMSVAQNFFKLDPGILEADLGYPSFLDGTNLATFEKSMPKSFADGMKTCFDRCGLQWSSGMNSTTNSTMKA